MVFRFVCVIFSYHIFFFFASCVLYCHLFQICFVVVGCSFVWAVSLAVWGFFFVFWARPRPSLASNWWTLHPFGPCTHLITFCVVSYSIACSLCVPFTPLLLVLLFLLWCSFSCMPLGCTVEIWFTVLLFALPLKVKYILLWPACLLV